MYVSFFVNILSKMKMNLYIKSMLCESLFEDFLECSLVHTKFKIDNWFARHDGDNISKKSDCRNQICQIFSSCPCEVFFHDSCEKCGEDEWTISLYSLCIQYVGTSYHSGGRR